MGEENNEVSAGNEQEPGKKEEGESKGPLSWTATLTSNVRSIFTNCIIILVLAAAIWAGCKEYQRDSIQIEPIAVPETFTKQGHSGNFMAELIVGRIVEIQERPEIPVGKRRFLQPSWTQVDIQVPGSGLSVSSIIQFIKRQLGTEDQKLGGELSEHTTGNQKLFRLVLRTTGARSRIVSEQSEPEERFNTLLDNAALDALRFLSPCNVASYYYSLEFKSRVYDKAMSLLKSCIANGNAEDEAAGFSLWGSVLNDQGDREGALEKYARAAGNPCRFAEPCSNWGNVLADMGRDAEAIDKFEQATGKDPNLASAYGSWGDSLARLGQYHLAVVKFEKALTLDPSLLWVEASIADALDAEGKYADSSQHFRSMAERAEAVIFGASKEKKTSELEIKYSDAHQESCRALVELSRLDEAAANCQIAMEIDPKDPYSYVQLGWVRRTRNEDTEALQLCRKAQEIRNDYEPAYLLCADVLRQMRKYPDALVELQRIAAFNRFTAEEHRIMGSLLSDMADYRNAVEQFRAALRINPNDAESEYMWAEALKSESHHVEALEHYQKALAINSNNPAYINAWAQMLLYDGKPLAAMEQFRRAAAINGAWWWLHREHAFALLALRRKEEAATELRLALSLRPYEADLEHIMGDALKDSPLRAQAVGHYQKAIALDPGNPEYINSLGNLAMDEGDMPAALEQFRSAADTTATSPSWMYSQRASALVQLERRQEAVAQYRLAIAANAYDADAEHDLGAALNGGNTSSSPAALPHYRRAALLEPNNPVYLNDLGDLLHDMNRRKEAQKQYLLAASTTRAESDMYWQRAYALFQLNRNEAALVQVRLGAAVNPDDDRVEHLWGDVEAGLGHRDDAMVHYRRAISLQPNNPAHHNALGSQLLDTGRPRETCEAMEQFRQAVATIGSWSWMADERNKALEQLKADVGGCEKTGQSATRPQVQ